MTDFSSTARRRELGAELRRFRESCGITGTEMAARLHWHVSTLSRAETGKRPMTPIEVATYLGMCGVAGEQLDELLELATESDEYRIKPHLGKMPDELRTLIFHESTARTIDSFQPIFIPGYLQTEEYARALIEGFGTVERANIPTWLEIRNARRVVLTKVDPALCTFLVHENAFRMPVGSPKVMRDQLLHLLFADSRAQCAVRVIPTSVGPSGTAPSSFVIFGYREDSPVVYLEHETTSDFLSGNHVLAAYRARLRQLASVALTEVESREWIAWRASEFDQEAGKDEHGSPELAQE